MVEIKRLLKYLKTQNLMVEEFLLLYVIWNRNEFPENTEMLGLSDFYYKRFQFYDREGQPTGISWEKMLAKLIKEGYVIAYPKYIVKQGNDYFLDVSKLQTTEKFRSTVFTTDRDGWFKDFVEVYGTYFIAGDSRVNTLMADPGETLEDIKNKFWTLCQNGNVNYCFQVLEDTKAYIAAFGNNRKITRYLNDYEANMMALKEYRKNKKELNGVWRQDL